MANLRYDQTPWTVGTSFGADRQEGDHENYVLEELRRAYNKVPRTFNERLPEADRLARVERTVGNATPNPTPNTLALRDGEGQFQAADPVAPGDVVTRRFLEQSIRSNPGPSGRDGTTWHWGNGAPPATVAGAKRGDFWLDMSTGDVYELT